MIIFNKSMLVTKVAIKRENMGEVERKLITMLPLKKDQKIILNKNRNIKFTQKQPFYTQSERRKKN